MHSELVDYVEEKTGKEVIVQEQKTIVVQDFDKISICKNKRFNDSFEESEQEQILIHELCHWAVATEKERQAPNLMLGEGEVYDPAIREDRNFTQDDAERSDKREKQAFFLEYYLFDRSDQLYIGWVADNESDGIFGGYTWYTKFNRYERAARIGVTKRRVDIDLDRFQSILEKVV